MALHDIAYGNAGLPLRANPGDLRYLVRLLKRCKQVGECWIWEGASTKDGYGQIHYRGKTVYVTRLVWALMRGPILAGHDIHHKQCCMSTRCIRPLHLQPIPLEQHRGSAHYDEPF